MERIEARSDTDIRLGRMEPSSNDSGPRLGDTALGALLRLCGRTSRWFAWAGGAAILLSVFPVCIDVLTRALFSKAWLYSYESSSYLFAVAVAFSYAHALFTGAHVRIELLKERLPELGVWTLDLLAHVALAGAAVAFATSAWGTFGESFSLGARSASTLGFPLAIPQGLWALGISWFALVAVVMLAALLGNALRGRFVTVERILRDATR